MRERNLPTLHAAQLLQLAAETGVEGAAIHHDETLTVEQKRGALAELQTKVRPRLDALVPPAVQPLLDKEAIDWFTALGDGRYATFRPIIFASGWYTAKPIPVTTPTRSPRQVVPLPRRGF